jgi:metallo-beta-lactamase family protein
LPSLEFLGAVDEVTGSCYLLHARGRRILIECGMVQGGAADEQRNRDPFPFEVESLDAVVLSHAHIDHSGRLPLLVKRGYAGRIYTHEATAALCKVMLLDSGFLQEREAEWANRRNKGKSREVIEPLYTQDDARAVQEFFEPLAYDTWTEIVPGVRLRLSDAGHILGSAIVEIAVEEDGTRRTMVFSGDLGHKGAPILRDPKQLDEADLVLLESTYGDRLHRSWERTWDELGEIVSAARAEKGNILIPAFAVGRTQELLYAFYQNYEAWGIGDWRIFLDSPMAIRATRIYRDYAHVYDREASSVHRQEGSLFDLPNLHLTETTEQSMAINQVTSGAIIIAGSGMCTGGRIRHHLKNHISRRQSHVVIVGFQAARTTGRAIVDGAKHITLMGRSYEVRAQVHTVGGLSAHADQQGLIDWYKGFKGRPRVALVHGEDKAMDAFEERLKNDLNADVLRPSLGLNLSW